MVRANELGAAATTCEVQRSARWSDRHCVVSADVEVRVQEIVLASNDDKRLADNVSGEELPRRSHLANVADVQPRIMEDGELLQLQKLGIGVP